MSARLLALCCVLGACDGYEGRFIRGGPDAGGEQVDDVCGDGRVTGSEKCDTEIAAGQLGACPTFCPANTECSTSTLAGKDCTRACGVELRGCEAGDGVCCPCADTDTPSGDGDCTGVCGDGVVQPGEKCEADPALASVAPCPTTVEDCDQSNPCREVDVEGSARQCSAECKYTAITEPRDDDMCCPSGATLALDTDCSAVCGNGVIEPGEDCDGESECTDCRLMLSPEQRVCYDRITDEGSPSPDCERCACNICAPSTNACRDTANPAHEALCNALMNCSMTTNCFGANCYCRDNCGLEPDGPCRAEVEAAAESTNSATITARSTNPDYALKYALDISNCTQAMCAACPH